jgi:hypothetical protein
MQVNQTTHAKNSENFIKIILKIKQKLQNITEEHSKRLMITVLLNKPICAEIKVNMSTHTC